MDRINNIQNAWVYPEKDNLQNIAGLYSVKVQLKDNSGKNIVDKTIKEVYERMEKLTEIVLKTKHIQGFCYTQLTDVEQETNGIYLYDRKTKFNMKLIKKIFKDQAIKIRKGYIQ